MKWRLIAAFAGIVIVVLLAQDIPLASYLRRTESERLLADLERDAFVLAGRASEDLEVSPPEPSVQQSLQNSVNQFAASTGRTVTIVLADGSVVATSLPEPPSIDLATDTAVTDALAGRPANGERPGASAREVFVAVPVLNRSRAVGMVLVTYPSKVIDDRANAKVRGLLLVGVISLLGAGVAAVFMATTITAPVRRLQQSTEKLAAGDFQGRADTSEGPPEIRNLATSFNSMTERIAALVTQQRAFAGDASHQLRTPLTALRLQLERAGEMLDHDPAAARERIEAAGSEIERLQRVVDGLLLIARAEGSVAERQVVDVSALAQERADTWEPFAAERGVRLGTDIAPGLRAHVVAHGFEQIVDNYLDNALAVSTPGHTVMLRVHRRADQVHVHVLDEGPGMPDAHLDAAFKRFWRAPDSDYQGSGLGLAIVQLLATQSGGRVLLRNRSDHSGLDASVTLAAAP